MAKLNREGKLREKRAEKQARKVARKLSAEEGGVAQDPRWEDQDLDGEQAAVPGDGHDVDLEPAASSSDAGARGA